MSKNQTVGIDSEDDPDDYDIAEANCELAMVEGQLCSIPYELYDLPDLTGIFSMETWNSILTEEERFFLSCFLPDMDQETFSMTMHQLVGGANLYFGNSLDKFYKRLRGGLFTPKVACCREGVTLFKRNRYYYSLKFYHDKMIKNFTEMKTLWDQYGKELGNKARLLLLSERTQSGNLKLLDLNRVPCEELSGGATYRLITPNEVKKSVDRNRMKSSSFPCGGSSENILKIKITKKGTLRYQSSSLVVPSEHHHQNFPKGILKVVPKSSPALLGEPYVAQENNLLHIHETESMSTRFAASTYAGTRCLLNLQDTSFTYLETTQSSIEGTKQVLYDPADNNCRGLDASNNTPSQNKTCLQRKKNMSSTT